MPIRIAALLIFATGAMFAQNNPLWRFWDARDGMPETYTQTLGLDAKGRLWATHGGALFQLSVNDGYEIRSLSLPERFTRVFAAKGDIWAVTQRGLFRLEDNHWIRFPIPQFDSK